MDASLETARFAAALRLPTLYVVGETYLPVLELSRYRNLARLKVGSMALTAALFFGAAIADCDATLRLSDGFTFRELKPLRERAHIELRASSSDFAAMLGALCLNTSLTKLDVYANLDLVCCRRSQH